MTSPLRLILLIALLAAPLGTAQGEDLKRDEAGAMAAANNAFAWDLYGALRGGTDNLFFSPYSVHAALQMTREGARGETAKEMDRVLRLTETARGSGYSELLRELEPPTVRRRVGTEIQEVPAYELDVANALWGHRGLAFEKPFLNTLERVYGAPLRSIDFGDSAAARKIINDWVEKQTRERIKDIVPEGMPPPLTRLALANAIYLKTPWLHPFKERRTKDDTFLGLGGTKRKAAFMRRVGDFSYAELPGLQVLELPYRRNALSMVVFLPRAADGLDALEKQLVSGKLAGWEAKLAGRKVDVRLPKFEVTTASNLTSVLPAMGMPSAFGSKADFSGMTKQERLFIGAVLHKAFVKVDEAGTEAAAATVVLMRKGRAPAPVEPVVFEADHPFVFVIRHRITGAILFAGRVTKP